MTRKKLTANRREGVYNRTGKPSVTFCERGGARKRVDVFLTKKNGAKQALLRRGGEMGIRTPEAALTAYTISSRAPSTNSDNSPKISTGRSFPVLCYYIGLA